MYEMTGVGFNKCINDHERQSSMVHTIRCGDLRMIVMQAIISYETVQWVSCVYGNCIASDLVYSATLCSLGATEHTSNQSGRRFPHESEVFAVLVEVAYQMRAIQKILAVVGCQCPTNDAYVEEQSRRQGESRPASST